MNRLLRSRAVWSSCIGVLAPFMILFVGLFFIDEPLRSYVESNANGAMDGYSVRIGGLDFHPIGFSLDLHNVTLTQDENPKEPVLNVASWTVSVHWRQLLHGALVSDHQFLKPRIVITRPQAVQELEDDRSVSERGWQDAVMAVYPLAINELKISEGHFIYRDAPDAEPITISHINAFVQNIRNVESPERTYPSSVMLEAEVFETGRLRLDGNADFLAKPFVGIDLNFDLRDTQLNELLPLMGQYNVHLTSGQLAAQGRLEYAPRHRSVEITDCTLSGLHLDYVHSTPTSRQESRVPQDGKGTKTADENDSAMIVSITQARMTGGEIGFVNEATNPHYRAFISQLDMDLANYSTSSDDNPAEVAINGHFMGTGTLTATGTFHPVRQTPDFSVLIKIIKTPLQSMNDLFRAYGDFDVKAGTFAFFSEVTVKDGKMDGYLKPFFKDIDVYDPKQDHGKGLFQSVYEALIGGLSEVMENEDRKQVATATDISGPLSDPRTSTWQILVNFVRNAFIKAIVPGLQKEALS